MTCLPNRSENDDRGGGDPHGPASFRTLQPERSDPDKVQKPSDMACSKFFLGFFLDLTFQPGLLYEKAGGDGADQAGVIGLIQQGP